MLTNSLNNRLGTNALGAVSSTGNQASATAGSTASTNVNSGPTTNEFNKNANPYQSLFQNGGSQNSFEGLLQQFETMLREIIGTPGNDGNLRGTSGDDVIDGMGGNDWIRAGGGNDEVQGGDGNDDIRGEDGNDFVDGGNGNDRVSGGSGNDIVWGGAGDDYVEANSGDDYVSGGSGNDVLKGNEGKDVIFAASQDDSDAKEWNSINGGSGSEDTVQFESMSGVQAWRSGDYIVVRNGQGDVDVIKETERFTDLAMLESDSGPNYLSKDQFMSRFGSNSAMPDDVRRALDWAKRNG